MSQVADDAIQVGPIFTVIMPTHDRPGYAMEAIESVRAQSLTEWELIVIDDGSPSPARVPEDERIVLLRNEVSLGPAAARNRGLGLAQGRFVGFLDDDDLWTPGRLAHALIGHANADVVVCGAGRVGGAAQSAWRRGKGNPHDWILDATTPQLGATTVRRDLCPSFDLSFPTAEDLDWWLRLTDVTGDLLMLTNHDWQWRRHDGPRHGIGEERRVAGRKLLMDRHADYFMTHKRALAFSWRRIGLLQLAQGRRGPAISSAVKSLSAYPAGGAVKLLVKALLPQMHQ